MGSVRTCTAADLPAAMALCARNPVANLFVSSRLARAGIERSTLGCDVHGYVEGGELVALLHAGANLVPVEADATALAAFADRLGPYRVSNSIMGPADQVMALHERLARVWGTAWSRTREVRPHQPLMVIDGPAAVAAEPRVRRIGMDDLDSYFQASVRMYTEEVGVSPLSSDNSYLSHVRQTIAEGRAFGIVLDSGRVVYKSDVGAHHDGVAQIQGVWLDPEFRGRRLAPPAMAAVVGLVRQASPTVSLYVNDFNAPALATYRTVGFRQVGEFATVLY